ncbi:MAG: arginine repressor [Oscillospiraceae bacterium]|jgi:transcriptional regulator of arginine metabolism|nr:arginine repressor [Oscillospiraceae bacterium]
MKAQRQQKILEIIENENIETQEDLAERLKHYGFSSTQATMSRDIKELRLVKVLDASGVYRYAMPGAQEGAFSNRLRAIFRESVTTCEAARNIVVIKTLPGLASAACSALDSMRIDGLAGTLAGDDTAFLVLKSDEAAEGLILKIQEILR